jgi:CRP-like cAMP-binding protein
MIEAHLKKLRARNEIAPKEEQAIRSAISEVRDLPADHTFIRADTELTSSTMLLTGMMCRFKDLSQGERQVTELHIAGDFVDLHSFTLKRLDHNVVTLTPCRVAIVPHDNLRRITERYPHLTRVYWFLTNLDSARHREWSVSLGRRTAHARIAHLFCELFVRLELVGLADPEGYELPLTQTDIAECMGLTAVHVNRMLQEMRAQGLITLQGRRLTILDRKGLEKAAEFDASYLYLEKRPR